LRTITKSALSLAIIATAVLILTLGIPSSTSGAGNTYTVDGTAGNEWTDYGANILLRDGDTLNITSGAGSPGVITLIKIDKDASVTINGSGSLIENLWVSDDPTDTRAHNVYINNLKVSSGDIYGLEYGYLCFNSVINLSGDNEFRGAWRGIGVLRPDDRVSSINVKLATGSTLKTYSSQEFSLIAHSITIEGKGEVITSARYDAFGILADEIILRDGAVLTTTFPSQVPIDMSLGTTVNLKVRSGNPAPFYVVVPFTSSTPGSQWLLSGGATFVAPSEATDNRADIALLCGTSTGWNTNTITLASEPGIAGPMAMSQTVGYSAVSTAAFSLSGIPSPSVTKESGDAKISWNYTTKKLDIAAGLAAGTYPVVLKASNGAVPDATFTFTLTVSPAGGGTTPPGITGPNSMILTAGYPATSTAAFTFTGNPSPTVSITGDPKITMSGGKLNIATGLAAGTYVVEVRASNGTPPDANFTFTLIVNPSGGTAPTVASVSVAPPSPSVAKGATQAFSATVTGTGSPSQAVTWTVTGETDDNTSISSAGLLTVGANETAASLSVKATSILDPTKSDTVTVTVISGTSGGDGGEGGGGNSLLYVVIAVVVIAAIVGVVYFLFKKKP